MLSVFESIRWVVTQSVGGLVCWSRNLNRRAVTQSVRAVLCSVVMFRQSHTLILYFNKTDSINISTLKTSTFQHWKHQHFNISYFNKTDNINISTSSIRQQHWQHQHFNTVNINILQHLQYFNNVNILTTLTSSTLQPWQYLIFDGNIWK